MYRNVKFGDLPHLLFYKPRLIMDITEIIKSKSYMMADNGGIKGFILLKKKEMNLQNHFDSNDVFDFLNIYQQTEFKSYKIAALFQKENNEIIYKIFDMVLSCLDNGDYLWGNANNISEHYLYKKLNFIKLNANIYAYQHTL